MCASTASSTRRMWRTRWGTRYFPVRGMGLMRWKLIGYGKQKFCTLAKGEMLGTQMYSHGGYEIYEVDGAEEPVRPPPFHSSYHTSSSSLTPSSFSVRVSVFSPNSFSTQKAFATKQGRSYSTSLPTTAWIQGVDAYSASSRKRRFRGMTTTSRAYSSSHRSRNRDWVNC